MAAQGGIIQTAMELVKEKERQGDKAMDRKEDNIADMGIIGLAQLSK